MCTNHNISKLSYKRILRFCIIFIVLQATCACEKMFIPEDGENTHKGNFDLLWSTVNDKYCFFEYKEINWDSIYDVYAPWVDNGMSEFAFFNLCANMLNELKDGHVNLWAPFNTARYWDWYLDYPQNYNNTLVERYYLGENHLMAGGLRVQLLRNDIGYIRYSSFMNEINTSFLDFVISLFNYETKGLIIDIRDNGGGYVHLADSLASRFVNERTLVAYNQYKIGPGHNQFSKMYPKYLNPQGTFYEFPVVVLINRSSYSSANLFTTYMGELPNVVLMGDKTGGGSGEPIGYELYNGWMLRLSVNPSYNINKEHVEFGIAPHIPISLIPADEANNIDTMIEEAITFLKNL